MKALATIASLLAVVGWAPVAQGIPVTIEFAGTPNPGYGVQLGDGTTFTQGPFSVTLDAFAVQRNRKSLTATDYQAGGVWQWSGPTNFGLGECNRSENCAGRKARVNAEIDNRGRHVDILRLHVDSVGTPIEAIGLSALQRNDDFAIYGSDDPFPNLFALTPLATGNGELGPAPDIPILQQFAYYFIVGKPRGRGDDFVVRNIVDSFAGDRVPLSVPEPGTLVLIASGITGLVIARARNARRAFRAASLARSRRPAVQKP
jgi:hypothetical protein